MIGPEPACSFTEVPEFTPTPSYMVHANHSPSIDTAGAIVVFRGLVTGVFMDW